MTTFGRRDWLRAAAGAILLGSPARAQDRPAWRFVVIADTHIGRAGDAERLERALPLVQAESPRFVLHLGDVVHRSVAQSADVARARNLLKRIRVPIHLVAGNHDIGYSSADSLLRAWQDQFGPPLTSFDEGNWTFLGVNSLAFSERCVHPELAEAALEHLDRACSRAANRHTVVYYHVPEFRPPVPEALVGWRTEALEAWRSRIARLKPEAIFGGHWHLGVRLSLADCPLVVAPSISSIGNMVNGYLRCTVQGASLRIEQVNLDTAGKRTLPGIVRPFLLPVAVGP